MGPRNSTGQIIQSRDRQRPRIGVFPKDEIEWPSDTWKDARDTGHRENANTNHSERPSHLG